MSQIFNLRLATETLAVDAQRLGVTPAQLQNIKITVNASIIQHPQQFLHLTYHIQLPSVQSTAHLAAQLNWPTWNPLQVSFTDYLWEQTCLECFIVGGAADLEAESYIEINASPSGRYALYRFNGYRNPSSLPPVALLQADKKTRARIDWHQETTATQPIQLPTPFLANHLITNAHDLVTHSFVPSYRYQRRFSVDIAQLLPILSGHVSHKAVSQRTNGLFSDYIDDGLDHNSLNDNKLNANKKDMNSIFIKKLHPCVILRFGDTHLYFAPTHASPPDFHQRAYWSRFDYSQSIIKEIQLIL